MSGNERGFELRMRWRQWAAGQPILALLVASGIAGTAASILFTVGLIGLDVGGLGSLMARSDVGLLAALCLFAVMTITLVSASMGTAIMGIGRDDDEHDPHGGERVRVPVRIRDQYRDRR